MIHQQPDVDRTSAITHGGDGVAPFTIDLFTNWPNDYSFSKSFADLANLRLLSGRG